MGLSWNLWLWGRFPSGSRIRISKSSVYAGLRGSYFLDRCNIEVNVADEKGGDYRSCHRWGITFVFYRVDGRGHTLIKMGFFPESGRKGGSTD